MGNASSDQAKESFLQICGSKGSGNVDEVKRILTQYPALLNEDSNRFGVTVLMHASSWNHVEVVEYLLTLPALKVNQQSTRIYGRTALHFASSYGHIKIVRLLLSHPQIDTSIKTWFGKTASEICCEEFGAIHSNKPFLEDLFKNHARGKTTVVPPPRPPRLSNKITVNPPLPDKHVHSPSTDEAKATDAQIDNKELKHEIKIEEVQIFQRLKFPLFLQLSLIYLKLLILKDELQFAIDTKAFQKAKEITAENKLWSQWRENLLLSLEDLPSFSQDLNVVKFDVLEQLESHFRNCLEKDESEDLLAGIDSFRTELINVIEESIFNQRQNMPLRLSEHVTTSPISHLDPSIFTYPLPPNKLTHVFLTHTWRRDEEGRDNHMRVARINDALKKRGIITWFDSDRMTGTIRSTMTKALYSTCCVLIFITREYEKKVNLDDESDNCYFEFKVVSEDHQLVNMRIPVVMDKSMTNPNEWSRGILKAELGGKLFFDMSSDNEEEIETRCDEIVGRMMELLKGKYPTYY